MSLTFVDANDCTLTAQAKVAEWEKEFMASYYQPLIELIVKMAIEGAARSPMIDQQKLDGRLSPQGRARLRGM